MLYGIHFHTVTFFFPPKQWMVTEFRIVLTSGVRQGRKLGRHTGNFNSADEVQVPKLEQWVHRRLSSQTRH